MEDLNKALAFSFIFGILLAGLSCILGLTLFYTILRAVLGLAFVLFIPGYIATYAFFKVGEVDALERVALSVGLSISLVVLAVMFSNLYLAVPINFTTIVLEIALICVFFGNAVMFQNSRKCMKAYSKYIGKATFMGDPRQKQKLFMICGISLIALFLFVDIFYPVLFPEKEIVPVQGHVFAPAYNLSDLYDETMMVYGFYPQAGLSENLTDVSILYGVVDSFEDKIAFLGYNLDSNDVSAGQKFHITYFWKCLEEVDEDYTAFVHVTDLSGTTRFQLDHKLPVNTSDWKEGDIIMEEYDAKVPADVEEGIYFIRIGLYDKKNGGRLPIVSGRFIDGSDRAIIARLNIGTYEQEPITALNLSDVYNSSMEVQRFYGDISETVTGIVIPDPAVTSFNDNIMFLGYDINSTVLKLNETFHITYFWKVIENTGIDYTVSVPVTHKDIDDYDTVLNAEGRLVFRHDHKFPIDTSLWDADDIIMEEYDITVPEDIELGTYDIGISIEHSGKRLPIVAGTAADSMDRAIITEIKIIR